MPATRVQKQKFSLTGTDVDCVLTTPITPGNFIVLVACCLYSTSGPYFATATVTDDLGNSYARDVYFDSGGGDQFCIAFFHTPVANGAVGTVSVHVSNVTSFMIEVIEYSGMATASEVDWPAVPTDGSNLTVGGAPSTPTATASGNDLLLAALSTNQSGDPTENVAWTLLDDETGSQGSVVEQFVSAGTYNCDWVTPGGGACYSGIVAYKQSAIVTQVLVFNRMIG